MTKCNRWNIAGIAGKKAGYMITHSSVLFQHNSTHPMFFLTLSHNFTSIARNDLVWYFIV